MDLGEEGWVGEWGSGGGEKGEDINSGWGVVDGGNQGLMMLEPDGKGRWSVGPNKGRGVGKAKWGYGMRWAGYLMREVCGW